MKQRLKCYLEKLGKTYLNQQSTRGKKKEGGANQT